MRRHAVALAFALAAVPAAAEEAVVAYPFDGSFDDAALAVESAIVGQGLVIDYVSHVGDMLNRTADDVGGKVKLYDAADIFLFCSAVTSRAAMEADPMNIAYCPYSIFVMDQGGKVSVGYRTYPAASMDPVEVLLDKIAKEAIGP